MMHPQIIMKAIEFIVDELKRKNILTKLFCKLCQTLAKSIAILIVYSYNP